MDKPRLFFFVSMIALLMTACAHHDDHGFDPVANPFAQLEHVKLQAQSQHKLILVIAGGAWCHWCRALDNFIHEDSELSTQFNTQFVTLKVYSGDQNSNDKFFATLPQAPGVPHFWVLNQRGELLKSQGTDAFEAGKDRYSKPKLLEFLREWPGR